jgi:hypothetical protein
LWNLLVLSTKKYERNKVVIGHSMTKQSTNIKREFKTPLGVVRCGLISNRQNSFVTKIPDLNKGEKIHIQYLTAYDKKDEQKVNTWLAVDEFKGKLDSHVMTRTTPKNSTVTKDGISFSANSFVFIKSLVLRINIPPFVNLRNLTFPLINRSRSQRSSFVILPQPHLSKC